MQPTIESEDEFLRLAIVGILTDWIDHDPDGAARWSHSTREHPAEFQSTLESGDGRRPGQPVITGPPDLTKIARRWPG